MVTETSGWIGVAVFVFYIFFIGIVVFSISQINLWSGIILFALYVIGGYKLFGWTPKLSK